MEGFAASNLAIKPLATADPPVARVGTGAAANPRSDAGHRLPKGPGPRASTTMVFFGLRGKPKGERVKGQPNITKGWKGDKREVKRRTGVPVNTAMHAKGLLSKQPAAGEPSRGAPGGQGRPQQRKKANTGAHSFTVCIPPNQAHC